MTNKYYEYTANGFLFDASTQDAAFVECYNRVAAYNGVKSINPNYKGETTKLLGVYVTFEKSFPISELQLWFNSSKKEHGVAFRQVKHDEKRIFTKTLVKSLGLAFDESKRVERQNTDRVFVPFEKLDTVLSTLEERLKTFTAAEQGPAEQESAA